MNEVQIHWIEGNCPVQAEGCIGEELFYFRARGNRWRIEVGNSTVEPIWTCEVTYGIDRFAAGWMDKEEVISFIYMAADIYFKSKVKENSNDY